MTKVAVIGSGAIGGTIAVWLSRTSNIELTICARTPVAELMVKTPLGEMRASPIVLTDPDDASPVDWVIFTTKNYDIPVASRWLKYLVGANTRIAVLQNGVEQVECLSEYAPTEIILPAVLDIPASRDEIGCITQHQMGWVSVPEDPSGADFVALFKETKINVLVDSDWHSTAWQKLCLNCAGAFVAVTLRTAGLRWNDKVEYFIRGLVQECIAVARAEGAKIDDDLLDQVVNGQRQSANGAVNSMAADRIAGRRMEIAARNGVIVRLGKTHSIETPINDLFVTLLEASEG